MLLIALSLLSAPAVIVTGNDPVRVGQLHNALEKAVGKTVSHAELAIRIGVAEKPVPPPKEREEIRALLGEAAQAFYDDRHNDLLAAVDAASAKSPTPSERLEIHLWRAAFFDGLGDARGAKKEVRAALHLHPELDPDPARFPASLREHAREARATLSLVPVKIRDLPASSLVSFDDRKVGGSFVAPPGTHLLRVESPGFRAVVRTIEIAESATSVEIPFLPAISLEEEVADDVSKSVRRGNLPSGLDKIAETAGADILVFADAGDDLRAVVWWKEDGRSVSSAFRPGTDDGRGKIAGWVEGELASGTPSSRATSFRLSAHAGPAVTTRFRHYGPDEPGVKGYNTTFVGPGGHAVVRLERGRLFSKLEGEIMNFDATRVRVESEQRTATGNGGSVAAARWWVLGYQHPFGTPGENQVASVDFALGVYAEDWETVDPRGLGVLPTQRRAGFAGRFGAGANVAIGDKPISFSLGASWGGGPTIEEPAGISGTDGYGQAFSFDGSVSWKTPRRWRASVDGRFELRTTGFDGESRLPVNPPIRNAGINENIIRLSATVGRQF